VPANRFNSGEAWTAGTSPAMTQLIGINKIVMPGLVPGIHGCRSLLNSGLFRILLKL
jgi:hypothetical protein